MRLAAGQHGFASGAIASTHPGVTMDNVLKRFGFSAVQEATTADRPARRGGAIRKIYRSSKNRPKWGLGLRELGLAAFLTGSAAAASAQDMPPPMPMPMPPPSMPAVAGPLVVNP